MTSSLDEPVEPGTLVFMHGTAANGGSYYGLAFVHERFANYNLVGFKHNASCAGPPYAYVSEAVGEYSSGWFGGVKREDFTVVELPTTPAPPAKPKPGYYQVVESQAGHYKATYYYRLTTDGVWEMWEDLSNKWGRSFAYPRPWDRAGIDAGHLEFIHGL